MEVNDPKKLTPETLQKIEEAAAMDCTMPEIALFANVSVSSLYNWMESDPKFKERLEELRANPILKARSTIVKGLNQADNAKWYLERKAKKEFAQRQEMTGADGKDLPTPIINLNALQRDNSDTEDSKPE